MTDSFSVTGYPYMEFGFLTGEVMTDERSVTARLLSPLRYLWEKYL